MNKLINTLVALILIMSVIVSCKRETTKDLSLTAEEYQRLGMPDHNRIWTNKDYFDANLSLSTLTIDHPLLLPRKHSKKSGLLFRRLVNEENLSFADDTSLPLHTRAYLIQQFVRLQAGFDQIYSFEQDEEKCYKEELIDLRIFKLSVHEKMLDLAWGIMNSDDESDISLQSGTGTVKNNYVKLIGGLLDEQVKSKEYKVRDLDRLSSRVSSSLIKNNEWFVIADRKRIIAQVEAAVEKSPSGHIRNNYLRTLKTLTNAIEQRPEILK